MKPSKHARDERRPKRVPLLIGSAVATLCVGAGVASAQTTTTEAEATDELTQQQAAEEDGATAAEESTEAGAEQQAAEDSSGDGQASRQERRAPRLVLENTTPRSIFWAGRRKATLNYKTAGGTADLRFEVVKKHSGEVVRVFKEDNVRSDDKRQVQWNGRRKGGRYIRKGRFFFRVETQNGQKLARKRADGKREFNVHPAKFPVRGKHQYWDGWGAGRGHRGQDIGAKCGTTMVAAEAGKVVHKAYDGGGYGYYVVVNVRGQRRAEVYAHLQRRASVRKGGTVSTGEKIGRVGASGNASGCHLHFEYWKGDWPGGNATPRATKRLRAWDKWS